MEQKHMEPIEPPSLWNLILEGRWIFELGSYYASYPLLKKAPKGDGHPVMVLPGFMTGDLVTKPLRRYLKAMGYTVYGWEQGINFGDHFHPEDGLDVETGVIQHLDAIHRRHGQKVSLVGWSLGGVYAREIARAFPEHIRMVITLGSPFRDPITATNVRWLYEALNGYKLQSVDRSVFARMRTPPPVPTTSIYTKSDGIVSWKSCLEEESKTSENIRVPGSHQGLGHNPIALMIIAKRLAQEEGAWSHYHAEADAELV
ncbi:MAG: alpha/beta hydrolase [Acidobacteria bacterium]|nr:alpha/beta hydrolase [Acidobacteriota bacterium]